MSYSLYDTNVAQPVYFASVLIAAEVFGFLHYLNSSIVSPVKVTKAVNGAGGPDGDEKGTAMK